VKISGARENPRRGNIEFRRLEGMKEKKSSSSFQSNIVKVIKGGDK
jgi:hypothetical protein